MMYNDVYIILYNYFDETCKKRSLSMLSLPTSGRFFQEECAGQAYLRLTAIKTNISISYIYIIIYIYTRGYIVYLASTLRHFWSRFFSYFLIMMAPPWESQFRQKIFRSTVPVLPFDSCWLCGPNWFSMVKSC